MSYKIGDMVKFDVSSGSSLDAIYSYVWRFWDETIQVSTTPTTTKRINIGGNPNTGNSLLYTCTPVMLNGQSTDLSGSIVAYSSPFIVPSPSTSVNDAYYGYTTILSLSAYTIDGATPLGFEWFEGATSIGHGVTVPGPPITHTWRGNDTSAVIVCARETNSLTLVVSSDRDISCVVTDSALRFTTVDFRLRGKTAPPLGGVLVADSNAVTTDATSQPKVRIGPGRTVTFVAYVTDISNQQPTFNWSLPTPAPGNWTTPVTVTGAVVQLPDLSFSSTLIKAVNSAAESVTTGLTKICVATCTITANPASLSKGQTAELKFNVELVKNQAPSGATVTCTDINGVAISMETGQVTVGSKIIYSAVSADADLDVVDQHWEFDNSAKPLFPSPLHLLGPKVVFDTTGMIVGVNVTGQVTSTDCMGDSTIVSFAGPKIQ